MLNLVRVILVVSVGFLSAAASAPAISQGYPDRPIRLVIPNTPGSSPDTVARIWAPALSRALGQPVILDYKAGAGSLLGVEYVARNVPADGYATVFTQVNDQAAFPVFVKDLRFDPLKDVLPVLAIAEAKLILASPVQAPWNTFNEMVAHARANPGKLNFGNPGMQSAIVLQFEAIKQQLGLDIVSVPYNGGAPFIAGIIAGQVQLGWMNVLTTTGPGKGRVKALAVTGDGRDPVYPDVPTFPEVGIAKLGGSWYTLNVPTGTPKNVIDKLNAAGNQALQQQEVRESLSKIGFSVLGGTPELASRNLAELAKFYADIAKNLRIEAR